VGIGVLGQPARDHRARRARAADDESYRGRKTDVNRC
jgi:hypothetical protein